jgi:hypothetical protein
VLAAALVGFVMFAFIWPAATAVPHGLPVAISGPPRLVSSVERGVARSTNDAVSWRVVGSRAAALRAVRSRAVDGAVVVGTTTELIRAGGAGPAESVVDRIGAGLGARHQPVRVTDAAPNSRADPSGSVFTAMAFPLTIGGLVGGIVISLLLVHLHHRVTALALLAAGGAGIIVSIAHGVFADLPGNWPALWGAVAVSLFATAALVNGLGAVLGKRGVVIAAAITILIANPISATTMPTQYMPGVLGAVGQYFVPGASLTLLRDTAYFPSASRAAVWATLAVWIGGALALAVLGHWRRSRRALPGGSRHRADAGH